MAVSRRWMALFARWHIWLGWLVAVPVLMWTVSGLTMVLKPIEEVRGVDRRIEAEPAALPPGNPAPVLNEIDVKPTVREIRTFMQRGRAVTTVTHLDGRIERFDAVRGVILPALDEQEARETVAASVRGGTKIAAMRAFPAAEPPLDFRRAVAVWQATLADGTHVYVGRDSGEIEAIRTRWWRFYDFMWGIHIMDLQSREDSHNPFVIAFGLLALFGALLGTALLFRRRKARPTS
jgi:uncharacterized iron-regulated membrane protein